jgi:hypothetical protein
MREYLSSHVKGLWRLFKLSCITKHYFISCFFSLSQFIPLIIFFVLSFLRCLYSFFRFWFSFPLYNLYFLSSFLCFSILPFSCIYFSYLLPYLFIYFVHYLLILSYVFLFLLSLVFVAQYFLT